MSRELPLDNERQGLAVKIVRLEKNFDQRQVLKNLDLDIEPGQFVAIIGRSGCGKSTLLRLIAGLETVDRGHIDLNSKKPDMTSEDVRLMFQNARLLPWQTVVDNVALGLPGNKAQRQAAALKALEQVGLGDRANEWPSVLSGGQRQRVALARALVHRPQLLLLDEPLGALDALTRIEMHELIEQLWEKHVFTAILVTHDVAEAIALADRVILIDKGMITFDQNIDLPRPRFKGDAAYAALEGEILQQLLQKEGEAAQALA